MTNLSPATAAVLVAYRSSHLSINNLAAALRAAADQVVPVGPGLDAHCEYWEERIRHQILTIATELEDHD